MKFYDSFPRTTSILPCKNSEDKSFFAQKAPEKILTKKGEKDPWVKDTVYYKTQKEAEIRMKKLKEKGEWKEYKIESFEINKTTFWRVKMKDKQEAKKENPKEEKPKPEDKSTPNKESKEETATKTKAGEVYLTFDDGPNDATEEVLDKLKEENVKATFFVNFDNYAFSDDQKKSTIERMSSEGHTIGNHTYNHLKKEYSSYNDFENKKEDFFNDEVIKNKDSFEKLMGKDLLKKGLLRLPYGGPGGKLGEKIKEFLALKGFPHVGWNVEFKDKKNKNLPYSPWEKINAASSRKNLASLPEKPVILMHDRDWKGKMDILQNIIKKLKERFTSFLKY